MMKKGCLIFLGVVVLFTATSLFAYQSIPEMKISFNSETCNFEIKPPFENTKTTQEKEGQNVAYQEKIYEIKCNKKNLDQQLFSLNKTSYYKIIVQDFNLDGIFESFNLLIKDKNLLSIKYYLFFTGLIDKKGRIDVLLANKADIEIFNPETQKEEGEKSSLIKRLLGEKNSKDLKTFLKSMYNPGFLTKVDDRVYFPDFLPDFISITDFEDEKGYLKFDTLIDLANSSVPLDKVRTKETLPEKIGTFFSLKIRMKNEYLGRLEKQARQIGKLKKELMLDKKEDGTSLTSDERKAYGEKIIVLNSEMEGVYAIFQNIDKAATFLDIITILVTLGFSQSFIDDFIHNPAKFNPNLVKLGATEEKGLSVKKIQSIFLHNNFKAIVQALSKDAVRLFMNTLDYFNPINGFSLVYKKLKVMMNTGKIIDINGITLTDAFRDKRSWFLTGLGLTNLSTLLSEYSYSGSLDKMLKEDLDRVLVDMVMANIFATFFFAVYSVPDSLIPKTTYPMWQNLLNGYRYALIFGLPVDLSLNYLRFKQKKKEPVLKLTKEDIEYFSLRTNMKLRFDFAFSNAWGIFYSQILRDRFANGFKTGLNSYLIKSYGNNHEFSKIIDPVVMVTAEETNKLICSTANISMREKILLSKKEYSEPKNTEESEDIAQNEDANETMEENIKPVQEIKPVNRYKTEIMSLILTSKNPENLDKELSKLINSSK